MRQDEETSYADHEHVTTQYFRSAAQCGMPS